MCWLRRRQYNTQHMRITREKEKLVKSRKRPWRLSQKGLWETVGRVTIMCGIDGNIIVSHVIATMYETTTRKTNVIKNQEPAHPPTPPHIRKAFLRGK